MRKECMVDALLTITQTGFNNATIAITEEFPLFLDSELKEILSITQLFCCRALFIPICDYQVNHPLLL
jgi:hypothetical protein